MSSLKRSPFRSPVRLLWLGLLVLLVHLIVLSKAIGVVAVDNSPALKTLVTRVIVPASAAVPEAVETPVVVEPQSKPQPQPKPKPRPVVRQVPPSSVETQIAQVTPAPEPEPAAAEPQAPPAPAEPASATTPTPAPPAPTAPGSVASAPVEPIQSIKPASSAASLAPNPTVPGSTTLSYQVQGIAKGFTYNASSTLDWKQDGARYDLKYRVSAFLIGERVQSSYGKLGRTGLEPERFSDKARSEVATHFDREKSTVIFSNNAPSVPLTEGAQDRISIFMQLSALLAGQGAKASSSTFSMQILSGRDSDVWTFTSFPAETLSMPYGEMSAIKVMRKPRKEFDQTVELWFAPAMGWIPVRLKISEANGDFLDQRLKSVTNP